MIVNNNNDSIWPIIYVDSYILPVLDQQTGPTLVKDFFCAGRVRWMDVGAPSIEESPSSFFLA